MNMYRIRLQLTGTGKVPQAVEQCGYELEIPLTKELHIDAESWSKNRDIYKVTRFWVKEETRRGHLERQLNHVWYFEYSEDGVRSEPTFQLDKEEFYVGQFINLRDHGGEMHIFKVTEVTALEDLVVSGL